MTTLAVDRRMRIVTAEEIRRSIAASRDPFDEIHRPKAIPRVELKRHWSTADPFAGLADHETVDARMVADRLKVSMHTVWRWAREEQLPSLRKNRQAHLFRVGDLRLALNIPTSAAAKGAAG